MKYFALGLCFDRVCWDGTIVLLSISISSNEVMLIFGQIATHVTKITLRLYSIVDVECLKNSPTNFSEK